ncbi:hypothetical protein Ddye_012848 [Dipteronia dyeriana]|uniref:Ubiquitin-like protease family profile domain-containing protein n=1 Tax=Dipteronia dyeriana TaxID=168575 RepID=A0AAE0CJ23_9ROSI|nr:hypothetical protein Ddye_012848 [Dipteronia dyeriana]
MQEAYNIYGLSYALLETSSKQNRRLRGSSTGLGSTVTPHETPPYPTDIVGSSHGVPHPPTVIAVTSHGISPPPKDTSGLSHGIPPPPTVTAGSSHGIPLALPIPRARKHWWQLLSPYTDPTRPKRPMTMPATLEHTFNPTPLVDAGKLEAYKAYKKNRPPWGLHDVDIMEPVDMGWFHKFEENYMELFDSVLIPCNIGCQYWLVVSVDLIARMIHILDPFRQEIPISIRKRHVWPLRLFLPSMLHQSGFHDDRPSSREKFKRENKAFGVSLLSKITLPQQHTSGNCGVHTLRLIEYILANRIQHDWTEDDMPTIREKMTVEVFCNSQPQF